jgi:hypothetical protein
MKYLRLVYVSFLLSFAITGCHKKVEPVIPPPQAQIPIISTMPSLPSAEVSTVELAKPAPPPPTVAAAPAPESVKKRVPVHPHRTPVKTDTPPAAPAPSANIAAETAAAEGSTASPIGQLSAEDTNINPKQAEQTRRLIEATRKRVKHLSSVQQSARKQDIAAINAFLVQAKQALNSNDLVGAQTLAEKAKILTDELLK